MHSRRIYFDGYGTPTKTTKTKQLFEDSRREDGCFGSSEQQPKKTKKKKKKKPQTKKYERKHETPIKIETAFHFQLGPSRL